ncbi:MAG TPA: 50S ribosomal protein L17 [Candidatus Levybacteria bacterium]|nr:50S ribosomal protein L17 [Candidatus Levybacteria bacterium]
MKKRIFGRRFKRDINQRKSLFRSLMRELVLQERIKTTEAKAKSIKAEIEKHVTKAKTHGEQARVHLQKTFQHDVVEKLVTDLAPRFANRPGGYTRIVKLGNRTKDNASMVYIEWVEKSTIVVEPVSKKKSKTAVKKNKAEKVEAKAPVKEEKKKVVKKKTETKKTPAKKGDK